jgi:hypothetical protein
LRSLGKTLLLILGLAALVALTKGFPQLRVFLKLLFLHPVGWVLLGLLGFWIYRLRTRPDCDGTRIIDDSPKRLSPPKSSREKEHV